MSFVLQAFGLSDVGLVRSNNEDVWAICESEHLVVLADGMGGHQAGEVASQSAVNALCAIIKDALEHKHAKKRSHQAYLRTLKLAIEEVNRVVYRMGQQDIHLRGMGTTMCSLQLLDDWIYWAHVGDSRIYRLRHGKLEQITHDHSLVGELIDMGQLEESQEKDFLYKNILTKAIGTEPTVEPSVEMTPAIDQDIYLLCSDGLTDHLNKADIEQILLQNPDLELASQALVDNAKALGGFDNITVIVAKVEKEYAF